MGAEIARLAIELDTQPVKQGADIAVRSLEKIEQAATASGAGLTRMETATAGAARQMRAMASAGEEERRRLQATSTARAQASWRAQEDAKAVRMAQEAQAAAATRAAEQERAARALVREQLKGDIRELALYGRAVDGTSASAVAAWRREAAEIRAQAQDVRVSRETMLRLDAAIRQTESSFGAQTAMMGRATIGGQTLTTTTGRFTEQGRQAANAALSVGFALQSVASGAQGADGKLQAALQGVSALGLAFGPGGMWVSALAQAGAAVVSMFNQTRDEITKTREHFESEVDAMVMANDRMAIAGKLNTLDMGGARQGTGGYFKGSIDEAEARLDSLGGKWKEFSRNLASDIPVIGAGVTLGIAALAFREEQDLKKSVAEMKDQRTELEKLLNAPIRQPLAAVTITGDSAATDEAKRLAAEVAARKRADEALAASERLRKEAAVAELRRLADLESATDAYYARLNEGRIANYETVQNYAHQREEAEKLQAATVQGASAVEAYQVALEIANIDRGRETKLTEGQVQLIREEIAARNTATQAAAEYVRVQQDAQQARSAAMRDEQAASDRLRQQQAEASAAPFKAAIENMQRAFSDGIYNMISGGIDSFRDFAESIKQIFLKMVAEVAAANLLKKAFGGSLAGLLGIAGTAGAQGTSHGAGLSGGLGLGKDALGGAIGGGLVGYGIGSMTSNRGLGAMGGALGGVAAGAAFGPMGMVAGGIAGLVGGLIGSGKKAREEARQLAAARDQWERAMEDFARIAFDTGSQLGDALTAAKRQYEDLLKGAVESRGLKANGNPLSAGQLEALGDQFGSGGWMGGMGDKFRAAAGDIREAEAIYEAFTKRLKDEFLGGLDEQLNSLTGNDYANQVAAINDQYKENAQSIAAAHLGEDALAKAREIQRLQLEQLAAAEATRNRELQEDLEVRRLVAEGRNAEADAMAFATAQQREYEKAARDGYDAQTLLTLATTQAAEAAQRAAAAQQALAAANQSLDVGILRFKGQDQAADTMQFGIDRDADYEKYKEMLGPDGFASILPKLDEYWNLAEKNFDQRMMEQYSGSDLSAVQDAIRNSPTSLNAAVTATAQQTDRLLAYTATSNEYLRRITEAVEGGSGGSTSTTGAASASRSAPTPGLSVGGVNRALLSAAKRDKRAAGNPGILI